MSNELWLGAACLIILISFARASLLDQVWRFLVHAGLVGAWTWLSYDTVLNWNLAAIYSFLTPPDRSVLWVLPLVAESFVALRAALPFACPEFQPARWRQWLMMVPAPSLLAALLLAEAHVFQFSTAIDFALLGMLLALSALALFLVVPMLLRSLLPERIWRIELYLLLRVGLLIGMFAGYALTTMTPTPAPDASFSWKKAWLVLFGIGVVAMMGALFNDRLGTLLKRFKTRLQ